MKLLIFKKHWLLFALGLILICFSAGCGKKGPPLPPIIKGNSIAAPYGLKYKTSDDILSLSWKYKADPDNAKIIPEAFEVFMAKKSFEDCEGCPFKFDLLVTVLMPEMKYSVRLEKGYKYYFRVQAVNGKKTRSDYSKTVQFEYK